MSAAVAEMPQSPPQASEPRPPPVRPRTQDIADGMYTTMSIASGGDCVLGGADAAPARARRWQLQQEQRRRRGTATQSLPPSSLRTVDIAGAQPSVRHRQRRGHSDLFSVDDIDGSHPKQLHRPRRDRPDLAFTVRDIDGKSIPAGRLCHASGHQRAHLAALCIETCDTPAL